MRYKTDAFVRPAKQESATFSGRLVTPFRFPQTEPRSHSKGNAHPLLGSTSSLSTFRLPLGRTPIAGTRWDWRTLKPAATTQPWQ